MIPNFPDDDNTDLKREYIKTLNSLQEASKNLEDHKDLYKKIKSLEENLVEKGLTSFVHGLKNQRQTVDKFFGELGLTGRGKIYAVVSNFKNIVSNFQDIVTTDLFETLTGIGDAKRKLGNETNSFVSRLLGAGKYQEKDEPPASSKPSSEKSPLPLPPSTDGTEKILLKISEDVSQLLQTSNDQYRDQLRRDTEASREGAGKKLLSKDKRIKGKLSESKGISFIDDIFGGIFNLGIGAAIGSALSGLLNFAKIATKAVPLVGAVLGFGFDAIKGYNWSEELGVDKISGILGGIIGGTNKGLLNVFANAGKWAIAGATAGSVIPVVGTIAGGFIGAALGSILGWVGGEKISKFFSDTGDMLGDLSNTFINRVSDWFSENITQPLTNTLMSLFTDTPDINAEKIKEQISEIESKVAERQNRIADVTAEIAILQDRLALAQESGNTSLVDSIQQKISTLQDVKDSLSLENEKSQEKIKDLKTDFNAASTGIFDKIRSWVMDGLFAPIQAVASLTGFSDKEIEGMRLAFDGIFTGVKETLDAYLTNPAKDLITNILPNFFKSIGDFISKIFTWDYWFGDEQADTSANSVKAQIQSAKRLEERRAKLVTALESSAPSDMKDLVKKFKSGEISYEELFEKFNSKPSSNFNTIQSQRQIAEYGTFVQNYKGNSEIADQAVKNRIKFISDLILKTNGGLFGSTSKEVRSAITDFQSGRLDVSEFKDKLVQLQGSDNKVTREKASVALGQFSQYQRQMQELQKIQDNYTRLTRANDDMTAVSSRDRKGLADANNTVVSNTTLNNNTQVSVQPSPYNTEPTFASSVRGRSAEYSGF